MEIYFYNTLSRNKDLFEPLVPGEVTMYTCGPTVYGRAHIGNMRAFLFADTLVRVLRYNGYKVSQVMNITDVGHLVSDGDEGEDRMMVAAAREKKDPWQIAAYYTELFVKDSELFNISKPTALVKATDLINEMIVYVEDLLEKGFAYEISDGIYYDITKFPQYGCLSRKDLEEDLAGARVEVNPEKRNPSDFAVWKKAEPEHIMQWDSPWGRGYPGWHLECSTISSEYFGPVMDIHTGGVDHIPIHHENEIAQSYGRSGVNPARFWMHTEFIMVDNTKMSKSLNNVYDFDDLAEWGYSALDYRYFCLNGHYRKQINFTKEGLAGSATGLARLRGAVARMREKDEISEAEYRDLELKFRRALNDDLNLPQALAVAWELARYEKGGNRGYELAMAMDRVLGLDLHLVPENENDFEIDDAVKEMIHLREEARKNRNWAEADRIRDELNEMGIELIDTPEGTKWQKR